MKTAAEWWPSPYRATDMRAWIQEIIDDARAGMVPEGECTHIGKRKELWDWLHEKLNAATVEHEAELAKAWEAAARAQREAIYDYIRIDWPGCLTCASLIQSAPLVQPPGGKHV